MHWHSFPNYITVVWSSLTEFPWKTEISEWFSEPASQSDFVFGYFLQGTDLLEVSQHHHPEVFQRDAPPAHLLLMCQGVQCKHFHHVCSFFVISMCAALQCLCERILRWNTWSSTDPAFKIRAATLIDWAWVINSEIFMSCFVYIYFIFIIIFLSLFRQLKEWHWSVCLTNLFGLAPR